MLAQPCTLLTQMQEEEERQYLFKKEQARREAEAEEERARVQREQQRLEKEKQELESERKRLEEEENARYLPPYFPSSYRPTYLLTSPTYSTYATCLPTLPTYQLSNWLQDWKIKQEGCIDTLTHTHTHTHVLTHKLPGWRRTSSTVSRSRRRSRGVCEEGERWV